MENTEQKPSSTSISKAWSNLVEKGVCAVDGSGDPDVEALFERVALMRRELREFRREVANNFVYDSVSSYILPRIDHMLKLLPY